MSVFRKPSFSNGFLRYDWASCFLGLGVILTYASCVRYWGFFSEYKVLARAFSTAMKKSSEYIVLTLMLYMGFLWCGWAIFSPYHPKFKNFFTASEALFSLINGDDMYATFQGMSQENTFIFYLLKGYIYIFTAFFIYMVLNVFTTIIIDVYDANKNREKEAPAENKLQNLMCRFKEKCTNCLGKLCSLCKCCSKCTTNEEAVQQLLLNEQRNEQSNYNSVSATSHGLNDRPTTSDESTC